MLIRETFQAGVPKPFHVSGNFFRLRSVSGVVADSVSVQFYRDHDRLELDLLDINPGDKMGPLPDGRGFDQIVVTSTVAQDVALEVARGPFSSERVVGVVEVIDGGLALTKANRAFIGSSTLAAVAAQFSHTQLWNPPGSGQRLIVSSFGFSTAASGVQLRFSQVALATPYVVLNPCSKLSGNFVSVGESRVESAASIIAGRLLGAWGSPAGNTFVKDAFEQPLVLLPGWGVTINASVVNSGVNVNWQFTEEPE